MKQPVRAQVVVLAPALAQALEPPPRVPKPVQRLLERQERRQAQPVAQVLALGQALGQAPVLVQLEEQRPLIFSFLLRLQAGIACLAQSRASSAAAHRKTRTVLPLKPIELSHGPAGRRRCVTAQDTIDHAATGFIAVAMGEFHASLQATAAGVWNSSISTTAAQDV